MQQRPRTPTVRAVWEEVTHGQLETLDVLCSPVSGEYCATCGAQGGLWTSGDGLRLCTRCGSIYRLDRWLDRGAGFDYARGGFWATIIRQLQLAEAARREEAR